MFNDNPDSKWFREFEELGVDRVRDAVVVGGWDRDKRQSARRWLERQDTKAWQAKRKDVPSDQLNFKARMRQSKYFIYGGGALLLLMGVARFLRVF